MKRILMIIISQ